MSSSSSLLPPLCIVTIEIDIFANDVLTTFLARTKGLNLNGLRRLGFLQICLHRKFKNVNIVFANKKIVAHFMFRVS